MKSKITIVSSLIVLAGLYRLLPHSYNFTPIGAMALVGGMYMSKKYLAFLLPIAALYLSDLVLNNTINRPFITDQTGFVFFADYMIFVYGAFILTVVLGISLTKSKLASKIFFGAVLSSLLFFVITNAGSWLTGTLYPKTFSGLIAALGAGIPFFDNTLLGNLIFVSAFVLIVEGLNAYMGRAKEVAVEKA